MEKLKEQEFVAVPTTLDEISEKLIQGEGRRLIMIGAHPDDQLFWAGTVYDLLSSIPSDELPDSISVVDATLSLGEAGQNLLEDSEDLGETRWKENIAGLQELFRPISEDLLEIVSSPQAPDGNIESHADEL